MIEKRKKKNMDAKSNKWIQIGPNTTSKEEPEIPAPIRVHSQRTATKQNPGDQSRINPSQAKISQPSPIFPRDQSKGPSAWNAKKKSESIVDILSCC